MDRIYKFTNDTYYNNFLPIHLNDSTSTQNKNHHPNAPNTTTRHNPPNLQTKGKTAMLTIHHLQVSQSDRLLWLCEELSIPYNLVLHKRDPLLAPPAYQALHPLGASPVLQDSATGTTLAESAACVEYIIHVHGGGKLVVKAGEPGYAEYLYWFHFANGTLQPAVSRNLLMKMAGLAGENEMLKRVEAKLGQVLAFMDRRLRECEWLAGEAFSAADVMAVTSLTTMRCFYGFDLSGYEGLLAWLGRVKGREAWRRAMGKGDPDLNLEELVGGPPPPVFGALRGM